MIQDTIIEDFGGLNFSDDDQQVGAVAATDIQNVDYDRRGRIRNRDAHTWASSNSLAANGYLTMWPSKLVSAGELVIQRNDNNNVYLDRFPTTGVIANIGTWAAAGNNNIAKITSTVHFGTPTGSFLYMAWFHNFAVGQGLLKRYNGAAISNGVGSPRFVAVSPRSNRLVQGYYDTAAASPSGANGSVSTIFFSDEGLPDTYTATNFVPLTPGDGESITGMVSWRELLFVFKQTKMFVFTGENTDDAGLTEFIYREVPLPAKVMNLVGSFPICAGPDGVYISTFDGIYRTSGDVPRLISEPIRHLWHDPSSRHIPTNIGLTGASPNIFWARGGLIAPFLAGAGFRALRWIPEQDKWSIWAFSDSSNGRPHMWADWPIEASSGAPSFPNSIFSNWAGFGSRINEIYEMSDTQTQDIWNNGGAAAFVDINWYYESGFYRLGGAGEKRLRFTALYGNGTVSMQALARGARTGAASDTAAALTLATPPDISRARRSHQIRGRMFAFRLSGTGRAQVNSLEHYFIPGAEV